MAQVGTAMGGGVASVIKLIMQVLPAQATRQTWIVTHDNGGKLTKLRYFFVGLASLAQEMLLKRQDIYHVHFSTGASTFRKILIVQLIRCFNRPIVGHAHGGKYERFYSIQPAPVKMLIRRFLNQLDALIVLSPEWATYFKTIAPHTRIATVSNAVHVPPAGSRGSNDGLIHILALGQLGVLKGTRVLIDAAAQLGPDQVRVHIDFVGDGDCAAFAAAAEELGVAAQVTFHGWQQKEALQELINVSSIFVLASFAEGLPMSMLESMARRIPVIVTPVGGIPSVVKDGINGLLVPVGDATSLAIALKRLIDDPAERRRIGDAGRDTIAAHFNSDEFARRVSAVYTSLPVRPNRVIRADRTLPLRRAE